MIYSENMAFGMLIGRPAETLVVSPFFLCQLFCTDATKGQMVVVFLIAIVVLLIAVIVLLVVIVVLPVFATFVIVIGIGMRTAA